jgi:hypothetical protein
MSTGLRFAIWILLFWIALVLTMQAADARFGEDAVWQHTDADGNIASFANENACWNYHFSQEVLTGSYCEPAKEWALIESTQFGVSTTGFKSELGCFMSGIIASHQQGVEAQCMYLGDVARR